MKGVVYLRVSTQEQVENFSLDTQRKACLEYSKREGIDVLRIFREEGESAKTDRRPQLQEMLYYCTNNAKEIDYLIVYRLDRLTRRVFDHQTIRATLEKLGIRVRAVQETFDDTAVGRFVENLMAALAQLDNDQRSDRTVAGMREGLSQGRWMWQAPVGYTRSRDSNLPSLVPDPDLAPLVKLAFERMATGAKNKREVLEEVTALGLNRNGKALSPQAFGEMLRNPLYMGWMVSKGLGFEGPGDFEPIVSEDLFERAQNAANEGHRKAATRQWNHPDFPLRRVVRCYVCNTPLTGSWSTGRSSRYGYYRCPRKGCGGVSVRKEQLEEAFLGLLGAITARAEVFRLLGSIVKDAWRWRRSRREGVRRQAKKRIAELDRRRDLLFEAYVYESKIDAETYTDRRAELDREIARLTATLEGAEKPSSIHRAIAFAEALIDDLPGYWNRLEVEQRPQFLRAVFPGGLEYGPSGFGTAENPWAFLPFAHFRADETGLVAPTGFEPALLA